MLKGYLFPIRQLGYLDLLLFVTSNTCFKEKVQVFRQLLSFIVTKSIRSDTISHQIYTLDLMTNGRKILANLNQMLARYLMFC